MAATKRNAMLIEEARKKIQTTQLINRLQNHAVGKVEMTPTQVSAASILLKKSLPDLAAVTVLGDPNNPLEVKSTIDVAGLTEAQLRALASIPVRAR
jgi:hypothetical protein